MYTFLEYTVRRGWKPNSVDELPSLVWKIEEYAPTERSEREDGSVSSRTSGRGQPEDTHRQLTFETVFCQKPEW